MTRIYRRSGGLAILAAAAAVGLAACSGGSGSPHVASLGGSGSGSSSGTGSGSGGSTASQPKGNPTQLLDEWAACMRRHGDPGQADPTIDANKVIHITLHPASQAGTTGRTRAGRATPGPASTAGRT